jgi:hypothetical protein
MTRPKTPTVHCAETSMVTAHGTPGQLDVITDAISACAPIGAAVPIRACFEHDDCHVLVLLVDGYLDPHRYDATWCAIVAARN